MVLPTHELAVKPQGYGEDFRDNRRDLAAALVRCEGMYVVVGGIAAGPGGDAPITSIHTPDVHHRVALRDSLREVVFALLTATAYAVQDRFRIGERYPLENGTSVCAPIDPDALIGGQLARAVRGLTEASAHRPHEE